MLLSLFHGQVYWRANDYKTNDNSTSLPERLQEAVIVIQTFGVLQINRFELLIALEYVFTVLSYDLVRNNIQEYNHYYTAFTLS